MCVCLYCPSVKSLSRVQLFGTPWTVANQAPLSMEFSRKEYWDGLPFSSPGDLSDPGFETRSPALQADSTVWATSIALNDMESYQTVWSKDVGWEQFSHVALVEKKKKTHLLMKVIRHTPVFLPGEASWTEEPRALQSMGSHRVGHACRLSLNALI